MTTKLWTKPVTQKVIKDLRMQGVTVEKVRGMYRGTINGVNVFSAMPGNHGYLVTYAADLFVTNQEA